MEVLNKADVSASCNEFLNDREKDLFKAFLDDSDFAGKLHILLGEVKEKADTGNILVSCKNNDDGVLLAKALIKHIKIAQGVRQARVLFGESHVFNKLKVSSFMKDYDYIIINHAFTLCGDKIDELFLYLLSAKKEKIVVFIDEQEHIQKMYSHYPFMRSLFTAHIEMKAFSDEELLKIGKDYAYEKGFTLDDMGSLALCARISEKNTYYHDANPNDARKIVDGAIVNYKERKKKYIATVISKIVPGQKKSLLERDFCFA